MEHRVAKRYARALFQASLAAGQLEAVSSDLISLKDLFENNPSFRDMLLTPLGEYLDKIESLNKLAGRVSPVTTDFLRLVVEKNRQDNLSYIQQDFEEMKRAHEGVAEAHIFSAVSLDEKQRAALIAELEKRTGLRIEPHFEVDANLIGGVRVIVGDTLMEGSITGQLKAMRERMYRELVQS
jgi:F-type H+-transporting ATPase subunit delta